MRWISNKAPGATEVLTNRGSTRKFIYDHTDLSIRKDNIVLNNVSTGTQPDSLPYIGNVIISKDGNTLPLNPQIQTDLACRASKGSVSRRAAVERRRHIRDHHGQIVALASLLGEGARRDRTDSKFD